MNANDLNKRLILVLRFLKDNDLYHNFITNIKKRPNKFGQINSIKENLIDAIKLYPNSPLDSTTIGFDWDKSFEGSSYWSEKSNQLREIIEKQNINTTYEN